MSAPRAQGSHAPARVAFFDVVRGFSVVSMVLFHLCYDLRYLYGVPLAFFRPPIQDVWRASISWTFLFVAGCMCAFSRDGLRRSLRYLLCALAVFVATTLARVDTPISFGIIFCMGASTLVDWLLDRLHASPRGYRAAALLFVAFLLLRGVPHGTVGIAGARVGLPLSLYRSSHLAALGFPGPHFASGDYYPLLPFCLMFLCGAAWAREQRQRGWPERLLCLRCKPLEWVGRHPLSIYLLHQPAILVLLSLAFGT